PRKARIFSNPTPEAYTICCTYWLKGRGWKPMRAVGDRKCATASAAKAASLQRRRNRADVCGSDGIRVTSNPSIHLDESKGSSFPFFIVLLLSVLMGNDHALMFSAAIDGLLNVISISWPS